MTQHREPSAYGNAGLPIEERVEDLLARMTIAEKAAQLGSAWIYEIQNDDQSLSPEKMDGVMAHGLGQITRLAGGSVMDPVQVAETANAIQRYLIEGTRLGIPAIVHDECCSGLLALNATSFPQIIGLASTWEPELARQMTEVIRTQTRAVGIHHGLAPVLDIARDPRWGRIEETFGEDPYLTSSMGVAYVRGLQGENLAEGVAATGKHFVGYSASLGGLNWGPAHIPQRELHEVHLTPFKAAVMEAGLASMMNAYQELDGIPCGASKELLTDLFRDQWGFDGVVVSDYMTLQQLVTYHRYAQDLPEAGLMALEAGLDVELPNTVAYGQPLIDAVERGQISVDLIDQSVRRVLTMKFRLGLFEIPYVESGAVLALFDTPAQRSLAREIAQKSMVLLKNDGLLPLSKEIGSVAVIGPNADNRRNLLGDYSYPAHIETLITFKELAFSEHPLPESIKLVDNYAAMNTVLDAISAAVSVDTTVTYAAGCGVLDPSEDGFAEAVDVAAAADVAVVVVGDKAGLIPDCSVGEFRDRATLDLPGVQQALVEAIHATGTPVVLVLVNGRPFSIPWAAEHVPAILEAWLPGEEGPEAIAEALFGDANPGGKLPVTVPRHVGQVPLYYAHKPSGQRSFFYGPYVDESNEPLFSFGFGLSYTEFELSNIELDKSEVTVGDQVSVSLNVANVGVRAGDEVVQLYIRTNGASVTRPVKELKGFARINLAAGESKRATFQLHVNQLGYYNREMSFVVEPADIDVMVGTSAVELPLSAQFKIVGKPTDINATQQFFSGVAVRG